MAETVRAETLERQERVSKFAIEHMEQNSTFPTARAIQTRFLEHQYPGNLNSIASDLKEVAKDISLVYQSKQTIDIDGDQIEIPKEALEYAIRSYQIIELQQRKKFDAFKEEAQVDVEQSREELNEAQSKIISMESNLEAKAEILQLREEQLQDLKEKLAAQEKELQNAQTKARETEIQNNKLSTELSVTQKHLHEQQLQHENEIKRLDNKVITQQDRNESMVTEMQAKHNTLVAAHETLKTVNDELDGKLSHVTEEKDRYYEENLQFESDKNHLVNDLSGMKASNNALVEERKLQKQQVDELRKVIQDLNGKIQSFEGHLKGLSAKPKKDNTRNAKE